MKLHVPPYVEAFICGHAHTRIQHFLSHISEDECLVAPIVDYQCVFEINPVNGMPFRIVIPHCVRDREALSSIRVRHGDIYKNKPFQETSWFQFDDSLTSLFIPMNLVNSSARAASRICHGQGKAFVFGNLIKVSVSASSKFCPTLHVQPAVQHQGLQEGKKVAFLFLTDRVRSTRGGYIFSLSVSSHLGGGGVPIPDPGGGVPPSQVQVGVPHPRSRQGGAHLGYPQQGGAHLGYPSRGYLPGVPPQQGVPAWGTPPAGDTCLGYPPSRGVPTGVTPW